MQSPESPMAAKPAQLKLPRLPGLLSVYRLLVRPCLFFFDAETMHHLILSLARLVLNFPMGPTNHAPAAAGQSQTTAEPHSRKTSAAQPHGLQQ
ncbi:MAG: hypothetical protein HY074_07405 [Deltaproteobacteria bacterium]|nr:hypothetical protein [Deltaproteobacteria bacterium]